MALELIKLMDINIDGIDFEVNFNVDQDIESRALYIEVEEIYYAGVEVSEIISEKLVSKIEDAIYQEIK